MGLEILSTDPKVWAEKLHALTSSPAELGRREITRERVALYRDSYQDSLSKVVSQVFNEPEVINRVVALIPLVGGTSFIKRVADELARPLYARAPLRRMDKGGKATQAVWSALSDEIELDSKMDDAARLLIAANSSFLFVRYVKDVGMRLDVLTGADLWTLPHPQVATQALAQVYERANLKNPEIRERVIWDDKRYFTMDVNGHITSEIVDHNYGVIPIVDIHRKGRTTSYYDCTSGNDLVSQTKNSMFLDLIILKKIKSQSHLQLVFSGDTTGFIKDQVSDEESVLINHGKGDLSVINLESDPSKIMAVKTANETLVGSNYGLAATPSDDSDEGLRQRVAELAGVMVRAERRLYRVLQAVTKDSPDYTGSLPEGAKLMVDLGTIHHRVDRKAQLEIRQSERSMGLRSGVDDVLEDNPEFWGDRGMAMDFIDERMKEEAIIVQRRRALNIDGDNRPGDKPGQSPEQNGSMGPAVRDGQMTKDEAAEQSQTG